MNSGNIWLGNKYKKTNHSNLTIINLNISNYLITSFVLVTDS